jgi:hypothetical protein
VSWGARQATAHEKATQQAQAWDLWLDCLSEREIAERIGVTQPTVGEWVKEKRNSAEIFQPPYSRQHFDVWSFQTDDDPKAYFGTPPTLSKSLDEVEPIHAANFF